MIQFSIQLGSKEIYFGSATVRVPSSFLSPVANLQSGFPWRVLTQCFLTKVQGSYMSARAYLAYAGIVFLFRRRTSLARRTRFRNVMYTYVYIDRGSSGVRINRGSIGPRTCSAGETSVWLYTLTARGEISKASKQTTAQGEHDHFQL